MKCMKGTKSTKTWYKGHKGCSSSFFLAKSSNCLILCRSALTNMSVVGLPNIRGCMLKESRATRVNMRVLSTIGLDFLCKELYCLQ